MTEIKLPLTVDEATALVGGLTFIHADLAAREIHHARYPFRIIIGDDDRLILADWIAETLVARLPPQERQALAVVLQDALKQARHREREGLVVGQFTWAGLGRGAAHRWRGEGRG